LPLPTHGVGSKLFYSSSAIYNIWHRQHLCRLQVVLQQQQSYLPLAPTLWDLYTITAHSTHILQQATSFATANRVDCFHNSWTCAETAQSHIHFLLHILSTFVSYYTAECNDCHHQPWWTSATALAGLVQHCCVNSGIDKSLTVGTWKTSLGIFSLVPSDILLGIGFLWLAAIHSLPPAGQ
jgi:hypothetical protein